MERTSDGKHVKWLNVTGHQQQYGEEGIAPNLNPENLEAGGKEVDDRPEYQKKFDDYCDTNPQAKYLLKSAEERKQIEADAEEEERKEKNRFDQEIADLRKEIARRADELEAAEPGKGWLVFTHEARKDKDTYEEMTLRVPRLPFLWWALRRTGMASQVLEEYKPSSYSGIKMYNDDPYHTDWLLGGGYPIFESYGDDYCEYRRVMDCAFSQYFKLQEEMLSFEVAVLCGEGYASGRPEFPGKGERCKKEDAIAIIPNAGPDYLEAALSAKAVIVERGGSMAHLVTVLRPQGVIIVREENAIEKYKWAPHLSISTTTGKITVMA